MINDSLALLAVLGSVVGIIGTALGIGGFFIGRREKAKNEGQSEGAVSTSVSQVTANQEIIKAEQIANTKLLYEMLGRLKSMENRVDNIDQRVIGLNQRATTFEARKD